MKLDKEPLTELDVTHGRNQSTDPYHCATEEEKNAAGYKWDCELLVGPGGFKCCLGEPEDRRWSRDASDVVGELNRLYSLVCTATKRNKMTRR